MTDKIQTSRRTRPGVLSTGNRRLLPALFSILVLFVALGLKSLQSAASAQSGAQRCQQAYVQCLAQERGAICEDEYDACLAAIL